MESDRGDNEGEGEEKRGRYIRKRERERREGYIRDGERKRKGVRER